MAVTFHDLRLRENAMIPLACFLAVAFALFKFLRVGARPNGLPPGPRTLPVIGNLHLMPAFKVYKQFTEWGQKFGPIYSLMIGSQPLIVLQSHKIARDLLDKRGANYSSRPDMYILNEVCSRGLRQVAMKYTPTWRQIHRVNYKILNAKATRAYTPYQNLESRQMVVDMLDNPFAHKTHIQRYSNAFTCQMVYGFRTTSWEDTKLRKVVDIFFEVCDVATSIPARLMDCYPILQRIPKSLLSVTRTAMELDQRTTGILLERWLEGKKKTQEGKIVPCYAASLSQAQKTEGFSDELAAYIIGQIVEAGSSTTSDELMGFLLAMVTHPEVQRLAQEEIDAVIGSDRLPTIADFDSMPYVRGCARETLRWMPTTAMLIPHSPLKDDVYEGYKIPAGTSVVLNVWALNTDPEVWPEPRKFDPSRFANETRGEHEVATSGDNASKRYNYVFGAGRRLCQGMHIAERSLFLIMSCMLWGFNITTPDPSKIDTEDLRGGLAVSPAPFECHIKPRDDHREEVMRREWQQMQDDFLDPVTKQWVNLPEDLPVSSYTEHAVEKMAT
ncbi:cytochrome P450 [Calycina marina]|uniref:Cytochrome P450 n=1 Tax=Calycina marina TaxID=1763456 RepID=A0A9P7YUI9_9HELO|nr:cytochrome P450 [Calycina marina]